MGADFPEDRVFLAFKETLNARLKFCFGTSSHYAITYFAMLQNKLTTC